MSSFRTNGDHRDDYTLTNNESNANNVTSTGRHAVRILNEHQGKPASPLPPNSLMRTGDIVGRKNNRSQRKKITDELEMSYLSAKREADVEHERGVTKYFTQRKKCRSAAGPVDAKKSLTLHNTNQRLTVKNLDDRPPILALGCDIMAHILTFLRPPLILDVLTMPLSKSWRQNFTSQPELWRVLCLVEPFKASIDDPVHSKSSTRNKDPTNSSSEESYYSIQAKKDEAKLLLDKYRLLYTSFVRCLKYISQIRDDAINGRPPAYIDYGISGTAAGGTSGLATSDNGSRVSDRAFSGPPPPATLGSNRNLQLFIAHARDVVLKSANDNNNKADDESKDYSDGRTMRIPPRMSTAARVATAIRKTNHVKKTKKNMPKLGRSMITSRLFGPSPEGEPGKMDLPWSCAIYSIVNWMVAFSDVEGIQILCLKVLPVLLENEQHRLTAQDAGLADVVLRAMVIFAESAPLHIAAFHAIVLLARPHGGREGMLFHNSMTADRIFKGRGIYQQHAKSGIAVMLDSMRRFQDNAILLAMSCWALVNIALVSDQKAVLVKLGGIQAITNAMYRHPFSAELQFRALFALINLVIPSAQKASDNGSNTNGNVSTAVAIPPEHRVGGTSTVSVAIEEQLGELNKSTEREIIDELVGDVASLVVCVMKNFCSNEAILNRACLVLHNLSLTVDYHVIMLWTPQCYQMLEWCIANYRTDLILQQSATATLHRLQSTLSQNDEMRARFSATLQTQQQRITLKQAQD